MTLVVRMATGSAPRDPGALVRLSTSLAGGEPPDLFLMNYRYSAQFAARDALEPVDPYLRARKEFSRLDAMGLVDAGERTRFVALVVEVLRDYMAARYPDAALSLTSRELVAVVRRHPHVPAEQLSRVLHEADLAKFAAFALSEERARGLARDARSIVEQEHEAMKAAEAARAAVGDTRAAA